jgi:DNA polymerase I-like protein with 3'-5' exonuclease and polymerase domains
VTLGREDARNWHVYRSVQMPALRMFFDMEETGLRIDTAKLGELGTMVREQRQELHNRLMREVPRAVRLKHADKGLSFSRANFVRDILFSEEGFALTPKVFTKSTRKLPEDQRIPSISSKEHLPFFDDDPWVRDFIQHQKMAKMESTYVGTPGGELIPQRSKTAPPKYTAPSGFWKYLSDEGKIHPSYFLHRTVTGRVASAYPNGQNFPKRGKLAKAFRKIFVPEPGWCFIQADLSQAEVRIVAWMSGDPTMLKIYREGGDIHSYTAASILGVGYTDFQSWKGSEEPLSARYRNMLPNDIAADCTTFGKFFDYKRFQAKAVVFGFLYGMGWKKFMSYAKTDYGITFNEQEARDIRATFFRTYSRVEPWHKSMTQFVNEHGYVRALHGSLRRLPNIFSPDDNTRSMTERMAINSPVQRFASDVGLMGMTRFFRDADPDIVRPSAFIHDAAAIMTRIEHKDEMASALKWYMQTPPLELWYGLKPPLPIVSDVEWSAESMGDLEEMKGLEAVRPSWFRPDLDEAFAK